MLKNISAKMVGDFNGCNPKLYTEKLAGGVKACLGFVKTHRAEYVPNTVLNTDIRTVTKISQQVIATYCKLCLNGMPVPLLRNCYSIFNGTKYR